MKKIVLEQEQKSPRFGSVAFEYYQPSFDDVQELYRVNDEPINIINNSENVPFIQNVANQQLVDVSSQHLDTSELTDQQLAASVIPRYVEINEVADAGRNALNEVFKQSQVNKE